jgi:hypothetical protein
MPDNVNTVVTYDDYIDVTWDGSQDVDKIRQSNLEIFKAAGILKSQNKPILLLLYIQNHPLKTDPNAFDEALKIFRIVTFDRMAIGGTVPPSVGMLISDSISSFNKELEMEYFGDRQEALTWLRSYKK